MKKKNRFLANKTFVVFSILAVCIILTAVFAPVVTRGVDPLKGSLVDALLPPCKEHIFGTDKMGRDIFSRVIYGARASLSATFGVAIIAIVVVSWTKYARLARSLVMKIRDRDYVSAAIVTGSKTPYMLFRYMLPNALPTLIITAATDIGSMMLELAAMSFLGFGAKPPAPEWGYMLNEGRACMQSAPWLMIFPGLAIFVVVVVFNMLGDSIRDILDPRNE